MVCRGVEIKSEHDRRRSVNLSKFPRVVERSLRAISAAFLQTIRISAAVVGLGGQQRRKPEPDENQMLAASLQAAKSRV